MKVRAFLLGLVVCAALGALVFLVRHARDAEVATVDRERSSAGSTTTQSGDARVMADGATETPTSDDRDALHDAVVPQAERNVRSGVARVVAGRVVIPPATPADEHVRLLVRVFDREYDGEWIEPSADGRFRIEFGPSDTGAELGLFARYLFLTERIQVTNATSEVVIEPELGAHVEGRLRVPAGYEDLLDDFEVDLGAHSPVGTQANWRENCERPRAEKDGTFAIDGAVAGWSQRVQVSSPRALRTASELFTPEPGETLRFEWDWNVGASLAGRVVDEAGAPIPKALVRGASWQPRAVTDERGRFELRGLPPEEFQLSISAPGFVPASEPCAAIGEAQRRDGVTWVLSRSFSVRLIARYPDGTPVPAPQFELGRGELAWMLRGAGILLPAIDRPADGELSLTGLPAIPFDFTVRAPSPDGDARAPGWAFSGRIDPAREREVVVVLRPDGRSLRGRVVLANGEPAVMASVVATALDVEAVAAPDPDVVYTSASPPEGDFELRLPRAGRWIVEANDGSTWSPRLVVDSRGATAPLELSLGSRGRITGRVVSPDGLAVEDAWVEGISESETSSADGSFDVSPAPRVVELHATRDGFAPSEVARLELAPDATIANVELRLRRGGTVVGRLASAAWRALDDVRVTAWTLAPVGPADRREATVDRDGGFRFDALSPGAWAFEVLVQGHVERPAGGGAEFRPFARVDVRDGEAQELVLGADGIRVIGRLVRAGRPVGGLALEVYAQDDGSGDALELESDAQGQFEFVAPRAGEYGVSLDRPDGSGASHCRVRVPQAARHEFVLELGDARLVGRLVSAANLALAGTPVEAVHEEHGDTVRTLADAEGRFAFAELRPGAYRVRVGAVATDAPLTDGDPTRVGVVVVEDVRVDANATAEVVIPVRRAAAVYGRAWSRTRAVNVAVRIVEPSTGAVLLARELGADGAFRLSGLPSGRVRFEFDDAHGPRRLATREVELDALLVGPIEVPFD